MTRPTVVISLDLEFSWGSFDLSYNDELLKMGRWTHDIGAPNLLKHLTRNGLSATWAIVGAMMRRSLPDVSGMPEVRYPHFPKPWFSYIPKDGDEQTHPEWFGASLVEMIRNATPEQEIGFHSFSHVPFGERGMTRSAPSRNIVIAPKSRKSSRSRNPRLFFRAIPLRILRSFAMPGSPVFAMSIGCRCGFRTACSTPSP